MLSRELREEVARLTPEQLALRAREIRQAIDWLSQIGGSGLETSRLAKIVDDLNKAHNEGFLSWPDIFSLLAAYLENAPTPFIAARYLYVASEIGAKERLHPLTDKVVKFLKERDGVFPPLTREDFGRAARTLEARSTQDQIVYFLTQARELPCKPYRSREYITERWIEEVQDLLEIMMRRLISELLKISDGGYGESFGDPEIACYCLKLLLSFPFFTRQIAVLVALSAHLGSVEVPPVQFLAARGLNWDAIERIARKIDRSRGRARTHQDFKEWEKEFWQPIKETGLICATTGLGRFEEMYEEITRLMELTIKLTGRNKLKVAVFGGGSIQPLEIGKALAGLPCSPLVTVTNYDLLPPFQSDQASVYVFAREGGVIQFTNIPAGVVRRGFGGESNLLVKFKQFDLRKDSLLKEERGAYDLVVCTNVIFPHLGLGDEKVGALEKVLSAMALPRGTLLGGVGVVWGGFIGFYRPFLGMMVARSEAGFVPQILYFQTGGLSPSQITISWGEQNRIVTSEAVSTGIFPPSSFLIPDGGKCCPHEEKLTNNFEDLLIKLGLGRGQSL